MTSFGVVDPNQGDLLLVLSMVLGAILLLATIWALRDSTRPRSDLLDQAWAQFGRRLARAGIAQRPNEGPLDLLARARSALPAAAASLTDLVQNYVALRYGAMEPAPERVRSFTRRVRNFRASRTVPEPTAHDLQR